MNTVRVSDTYQILLPPAIRTQLGIIPGQEVQVILYNNRIELIPLRKLSELRGFLKGIDTEVKRDADRI